MQNYKELEVYHLAFDISVKISKEFNKKMDEKLGKQLLRSITSIPSAIAEMCAYDSNAQIAHMLKIALGEIYESDFWINYYYEMEEINLVTRNSYISDLNQIREIIQPMISDFTEKSKIKKFSS